MQLKITAQVHREGKWFIAFCPEFPEANGQGQTNGKAIRNLHAAVALLEADRQAR